jgi:DNA polymerase III subunit beta
VASITITQDVEKDLAALIRLASSPEHAAVATLNFLRELENKPATVRVVGCNGAALYHALGLLKKAVYKKTTMPVLKLVHVKKDGDDLVLTTTDMEFTYRARVQAADHPAVEMLVDHELLYKTLASAKKAKIEFARNEIDEDRYQVEVRADGIPLFTSDGMPVDEYPLVATEDSDYHPPIAWGSDEWSMPLDLTLAKHLARFASSDQSHPVLMCAGIQNGTITTADGFRLLSHPTYADDFPKTFSKREAMVKGKALADAATAIADGAMLSMGHDDRDNIWVKISGVTRYGVKVLLVHVAQDGSYPDVLRIIPARSINKYRIETEELIKALQAVKPIAVDVAGIVQFDFDPQGSAISASSEEMGQSTLDLPAVHVEGEVITIAFNVHFMLDAASYFKDAGADEIMLGLNTPTNPLVMTAADQSSGVEGKIVVMPMHLGRRG